MDKCKKSRYLLRCVWVQDKPAALLHNSCEWRVPVSRVQTARSCLQNEWINLPPHTHQCRETDACKVIQSVLCWYLSACVCVCDAAVLTFSLSLLCVGQHLDTLYLCQPALLWSRLPACLREPADQERLFSPPDSRETMSDSGICLARTCQACWLGPEVVVVVLAAFWADIKWRERGVDTEHEISSFLINGEKALNVGWLIVWLLNDTDAMSNRVADPDSKIGIQSATVWLFVCSYVVFGTCLLFDGLFLQ